MVSLKQTGFAGGFLSSQFLGRSDQTKYQTGLRECRNFLVTRFGSVENRPGTIYCGEVKTSANRVRLVKFIFNASVSYLLEFGNDYMRVWKNGAHVGVTGAPAYAGGTTYAIGDLVTSGGIVYWSIQAGNVGHAPAGNPTWWHAQTGDFLELLTTIGSASLSALQYVQQADIMTIVQQLIAPQSLRRYSDTDWAISDFTQTNGIDAPTNVNVIIGVGPSPSPAAPVAVSAIGGDGAITKSVYQVTAWTTVPPSEGVPSTVMLATVGGATAALPVVVTWGAVAGADGYAVYKKSTIAPALQFIIGIVKAGTVVFNDTGILSALPLRQLQSSATGTTVFTYAVTAINAVDGSESLISASASGTGNTPSDANPNVITWTAPAGSVLKYNVYRQVAGIFSFIGSVPLLTFSDTNILPDSNIQPPTPLGLFATANDYPAVVGYYQQRLGFANSINAPQTVNFSRIGTFTNFSVSTPVQDSDALSFTIAGKQVQEVRALVDNGKLIVHSSGGEYVAQGNQAGAITPTAIGLVRQGSAGSSIISPIVIGNVVLFVQARGSVLRELSYSIQAYAYVGKDETIFAPTIFATRTVVDMDWQQIPNSIVWMVLDNGELVGLTYLKEQEVWAWHHHDTINGSVENVCVVAEGENDTVYLTVKRTIGGVTKRYIERLANRFTDISTDAVYSDCSLTFDGRNTSGQTMTLTGSGWTPTDNLTLTTSALGYFAAGDVGNAIVLQQIADGSTRDDDDVPIPAGTVTDQVTLSIIAQTSGTVVTVQPDKTVPAWAQALALTAWGRSVHTFAGIDHLNGQTLVGLGDGQVTPAITVSGGGFTTAQNYMVLTAGLPITADLQTLPVENTQGETIDNKNQLVTEVTATFYESRGGYYGQDVEHLFPLVQRATEPWGDPDYLLTGPRRIPVQGDWQTTGQVWIRQSDPLPMGISAIVPTGYVGS